MATATISPLAPPRTPAGIGAVLGLIGFSAIVSQIVLLRELLVVFYGNEMSAGVMLAAWLLWTAFGSSVLGRLGTLRPRAVMASLEILIALILPATIFAVRASREAFHALPGEVLGPGAILLTSLVALSALCSAHGWLFAAGARLYASEMRVATGVAGGKVYLAEAAGSALGGLLASLLLVRHWNAFAIALFVALLNGIAALWLTFRTGPWRWTAVALLAAGVGAASPAAQAWLEQTSLVRLWRGMQVLTSRESYFGNLTVIQNEGSRTLFVNGLPMFTVPDVAAAEETVHYALLQHPAPRRLLLIGGGLNGSITEALQHPSLEHVDYVELDPQVFRIAAGYFPAAWRELIADRHVRILEGDGRRLLKQASETWDVVVVNLPEPQTAQLNRFYTREFFRETRARLSPGGLLSFQLRSSENYLSPERAAFLRCIYRTLREVFPEVGFIPGETVHFFAGSRNAIPEAGVLLARLRQRGLQTRYVREYFLPFRMMPDRMEQMAQVLHGNAATPVNRDFAPVAYYFGVALWSTQFNHAYRVWFEKLSTVPFGVILAAVAIAALATLAGVLLQKSPSRRRNATTGLCVAAAGFNLMGLEVLLLLGFQAIYGYLYHQLAILLAMFMAGMAAGSAWGLRKNVERGSALAWLQIAVAMAPGLLCAVLFLAEQVAIGLRFQRDYLGEALFAGMALAAGMLGGMQFTVASRMTLGEARRDGGSGIALAQNSSGLRAGTLYALDLLGACAGAVMISGYLAPVFGFAWAAALMAVVATGPAILAALGSRRKLAG
jgi:spermidine synthase